MNEFLDHLRRYDELSAHAQIMRSFRLEDPSDPDFALTPRTQRLRIQGTEGADSPKVRPLVVGLIVPASRMDDLWKASDVSIYQWLSSQERKYEPLELSFRPGDPRPMHNGIIMEEPDHRRSHDLSRYLAVHRNGIIEMGLGRNACLLYRDEVGFLLTPIVAHVWALLGFAGDFFKRVACSRPFSLLLVFRETQNALLAGLARGWREPWGSDGYGYRPVCREPAFVIKHEGLGPLLNATDTRALAREIAVEIEAAWGHGGPDSLPRCFCFREDKTEGEFDTSAMQR